MSDPVKKYTIEDVRDRVEIEGLSYTVTDYIHPNEIEDDDLRHWWGIAREALVEIESMILDCGDEE